MALYVHLADAALIELRQRAKRERRRPQDEAAFILERALEAPASPAERDDGDTRAYPEEVFQ